MHKLITLLTSLVFALYFCQQWSVTSSNFIGNTQIGREQLEFKVLADATNQVLSGKGDSEALEMNIESLPNLNSGTRALKSYYLKGIIGKFIQNVKQYTDLVSAS